jgi:hypothetical protein
MSKILKKSYFDIISCLYCIKATPKQTYALGLSTLLQKYKMVFQDMPMRHPPERGMLQLTC